MYARQQQKMNNNNDVSSMAQHKDEQKVFVSHGRPSSSNDYNKWCNIVLKHTEFYTGLWK